MPLLTPLCDVTRAASSSRRTAIRARGQASTIGRFSIARQDVALSKYFRYVLGNHKLGPGAPLATERKTSLSAFRRRLRRRGMICVGLQVPRGDADLVRSVARALCNPKWADEARAILGARFAEPAPAGLKALLASAPLEGVDLDRPRDVGRGIQSLRIFQDLP